MNSACESIHSFTIDLLSFDGAGCFTAETRKAESVTYMKPQKSGNNHLSHLNRKKNYNNSQLNSKHRLRANIHVDCVKEYADHIGFI